MRIFLQRSVRKWVPSEQGWRVDVSLVSTMHHGWEAIPSWACSWWFGGLMIDVLEVCTAHPGLTERCDKDKECRRPWPYA